MVIKKFLYHHLSEQYHHQIHSTTCNQSHTIPDLCCHSASEFAIYFPNQNKYKWLCRFDDDQYVNVNQLREYLSTFDSTQPYYIGRPSWPDTVKRSKEPFPSPFWFATLGGGVCLSKRTVILLRPYTQDASEFADGCVRENYHPKWYEVSNRR